MNTSETSRIKRHLRIRKKVMGTSIRPRLSVHRSHKNLYVQLVDDINGHTILSVSTNDQGIKSKQKNGGNTAAAALLGSILAARAKEKNITQVVFDRAGYLYHGRVKALGDEARKAGLKF